MRVQAVRPGIHVVSGFENGNVLVLASDTGLLLVDAQSHQRVSALDRALAGLLGGRSPHRVRAVVNTHYHGDHTEGNAFFRQLGATVIAHRNAAMQAAKGQAAESDRILAFGSFYTVAGALQALRASPSHGR